MVGASRKRILVDARVGWGAGIGRYIANLMPEVASRLRACDFTLLVESSDIERATAAIGEHANIELQPTDIRAFSMGEQTRLPALGKGYDLTWFTNYWVPLRWQGAFVVTVHDLLHLDCDLFPASQVKRKLSRMTFAKIRRDAHSIMFDSRFSERVFENEFGRPRNGLTVHLGVDHKGEGSQLPSTVVKARRVLVVGASKKHKNFGMALAAWRRARISSDWTLTIVTPNEQLRSSIDLAGLAKTQGGVDLRHGISNAELDRLYSESSLILTPSLYEGFGFPLLEGLRAGAMCVSSTAEALVEIGEGAFVTFVNGTDIEGWTAAIERHCVMIDTASFDPAELIEHNRRWADSFTWARAAEKTAAVLEAALQNRG